MMKSTINRNFIPASDSIDLLFADYFSEDRIKIREHFNNRSNKLNINSVSYRTLNHWEKSKLIDVERGEDGTGWRKFSLMDTVWVHLIVELRKFGVSIENIKHIKDQLTDTSNRPSVYPWLEFYTAFILSFRRPVYVMIVDEFRVLIATNLEIESALIIGSLGNHIRISLHDILRNIFKIREVKIEWDMKTELSSSEMQLILELRTGQYRSIAAKMKDGKMIRLEKEAIANKKSLHEILKGKDFDKLIIDRENGDVVNITQIIKNKF